MCAFVLMLSCLIVDLTPLQLISSIPLSAMWLTLNPYSAREKISFSIDLGLMCLRNTFHHSPLSQYLSLPWKPCIAAREIQPAQASKPPVRLGHFWGTPALYLELGNNCLTHTKGRTSSDTENGTLEPAKNCPIASGVEKRKGGET